MCNLRIFYPVLESLSHIFRKSSGGQVRKKHLEKARLSRTFFCVAEHFPLKLPTPFYISNFDKLLRVSLKAHSVGIPRTRERKREGTGGTFLLFVCRWIQRQRRKDENARRLVREARYRFELSSISISSRILWKQIIAQ